MIIYQEIVHGFRFHCQNPTGAIQSHKKQKICGINVLVKTLGKEKKSQMDKHKSGLTKLFGALTSF